MSISVGIDLGTTFSAVAYIDPKSKSPQIIPNREGKRITPSVIQFLDGDIIFGSEAEDAYNAGEPNCVATFKREMGNDEPYCYIDGVPCTSEKLSSLLLRYLKENAEEVLGDTIKDAVITVPAYFYSREREATYRAAEAAGLKVKKIIDEPNAAAMAYGLNNWRENANILVYDLGGGTFDVTLVHMGKTGELSTVTTRGNHKLGGRDWDNRIEDTRFYWNFQNGWYWPFSAVLKSDIKYSIGIGKYRYWLVFFAAEIGLLVEMVSMREVSKKSKPSI